MTTVSILGTATINLPASATPGAQAVTVPVGTQGVVVFTRVYNALLLTLSSSFAGAFSKVEDTGAEITGVHYAPVSATGAQTITPTWTGVPGDGPLFVVVFVGGIDNSSISAWVRGAAALANDLVGAGPSRTVASTANDLVLALDSQYRVDLTLQPNEAGWTSITTQAYNKETGRLRSANSPGASTTTATGQSTEYSGIAIISLISGPTGPVPVLGQDVPRRRSALTPTAMNSPAAQSGYGRTNAQRATQARFFGTPRDGVVEAPAGGVIATLAQTDAPDTVSTTAALTVAASASITDAADTVTTTAGLLVAAGLTLTDAADALASTAALTVAVSLTVTDAADTVAAEAVIGAAGITAELTVTDAADTVTSTATLTVGALLAVTDAADTVASTAVLPVAASLSLTDAADTLSAAATVAVVATASITDQADTFSSAAGVLVVAMASITDQADTLSATAEVVSVGGVSVNANITDAPDTVTATAEALPLPVEDESLGGRRRRNWRTFNDLPTWEVPAEAVLFDDADTVTATATVEPMPVLVAMDALDDDDRVSAACVVRWPVRHLLRTSPPLVRTTAGARM